MLDSLFTYTDADLSVSEAEEVALIERAQTGDDDATLTLLHAYGPAIRSAVSRFTKGSTPVGGSDLDVEDVQAAALTAFLEVVAEHDPALNPRLAGRLVQRLSKRLAEEFTTAAAFTVPERTLSRFYGILRAADGDVEAALEIVTEHGMSREVFLQVLGAVRGTDSLEGTTDGDEDSAGYTGSATPVFTTTPVVDVEDRILVDLAFAAVEDDEERICRLSYGFTEYDPQPDAEIAHRLNLTRPTVQRKRARALDSMRKALGVGHEG